MFKRFRQFVGSPVFPSDNEKSRAAYLLNVFAISSLLAASVYGFIAPRERMLYGGLAVGVTLIAWGLMKRGYIRWASRALVAGLFLVVAGAATVAGGVAATEFGAFIVPILFSGLLLGWRTTVVVTVASILFGGLLIFADRHSLLRPSVPYDLVTVWIIDSLYFILAGVFLGLAIQLINQSLRNVQRELQERKNAEERLLQFRQAMDESNDAIYIIDLETSRYLDFNRSAHVSLGYSRKELGQLSLQDVAGHITSLEVWHERVQLIEENGGLIFETVYRRKDGTAIEVEVSARMWDYEGNRAMIATVRDISERKVAEKILQESDARLRMILESAIDGFISINSDGIVLEWNEQAARIFGWSRDEAIGQVLGELIIPESQRQAHHQGLRRFAETGEGPYLNRRIEAVGLHRDGGPVPIELAIVAVPVEKGFTFAAFVRDITLNKQLEEEREGLIDQLEARRSESDTLRDSLASIVGKLGFSEIIEDILEQLKRVVPYDTASVWRVDGNMQKYVTGRNVPPEITGEGYGWEITPENSAYSIFIGDDPYLLNLNVQEELKDFQMPPHDYVQSWLAVPLKTRGQIIGLIALDGREKYQFTQHHADLAVTFANQVAIALENSRLFSELQTELAERTQAEIDLRQRESILAAVAEAANLLLKTPDWKLEIDTILEKLGQTINATHAYLCENHSLPDGTQAASMSYEWTAPGYHSDLGDPEYQNVPLLEPDFVSWFEILSSGLPYIGDERQTNKKEMEFILARGMKSLLDVPIFVDGAWWGTIGFDDMEVARIWSSAEVDALLVAANIIGGAIQRQRADLQLKEELSQRKKAELNLLQREAMLAALADSANRFLQAPDWRTEIDFVLQRLGQTLNASHAYLFEKHMSDEGEVLNSMRYEWTAPGQKAEIDNLAYQNAPVRESGFERYYQVLDRGDPFVGSFSSMTGEEREKFLSSGIKALLEMRIVVDGVQWGTIGFDEMTTNRDWTPLEVDVLRLSATVLGAAIKRRQAELNLRQREAILEVVADAANRLLQTSDWRAEIDGILQKLGMTIRASHAYLFENHPLPDGRIGKSMRFEWTGPGCESDLGNLRYINQPILEHDFKRWLDQMNSGKPFIGDHESLGREDVQSLLGEGMKAMLDVPIHVGGQWWGIIGFDDMVNFRGWSSSEIDALVVAANVLGAAIHRQQADVDLRQSEQSYRTLYETAQKQAQELALLSSVRNAMAEELDLPTLLRNVVESVADSFGYTLVSLYLIKDEMLILQHQVGYEQVIARIARSDGIAGRVVVTGRPVLLEDVHTDPNFLGAVGGIVSEICIPLFDEGRVVGVLNVESTQGVKLTESDMKLLAALSEHIGIAIGRARLYTSVQEELEARKRAEIEREKLIAELELKNIESETLRESVAIVTATLEKEEAISRILEQLERVVPYDSASVQLIAGNMLEIVSARRLPVSGEESDSKFEINEGEPAYPVLQGRAPYVLFDDVQLDAPAFTTAPHDRIHAWLAVPLKVKGQIIGIIALDGYRIGQFTERHAQLAVTYANQVAAALENARLYSDLQDDLAIRQNLIAELEAKNAELERFTYTVSHDLKAPLFTIRGFLGYLEQDAFSGDMKRLSADIQRIADATEKMQHLLNDLLELSRIGRLMNEPQQIKTVPLIHEVLELLHGQIVQRGVRVVVQEDMSDVVGDRQRLLEVVQNLVENSVKFIGDQSSPVIEIGQDGTEEGKPIFFVRDNGIGVPPEHYERIFGLFNKLDPRSSGTGIGLALVKRIVEFHGGRIWVESGPAGGATFYFTLPPGPVIESVI